MQVFKEGVYMWGKVQGDAVHPAKALQSALLALTDLELRFMSLYASSMSPSNS